MTLINANKTTSGGDIPSDIAHVEQLHSWSGQLLQNLYGGELIQEVSNGVQVPIITINQGRTGSGVLARVIRTLLIVDNNYATMPGKDWLHVKTYPFNSTIIPDGFKAN